MHLTNYAINKESEKFQQDESAFKKSLKDVLEIIREKEGDEALNKLNEQMRDMIVKTLLVGWPHLDHNYKTCTSKSSYQNYFQCFQILGIDIMLDKKLKPWLLEVNESPSFNDDTEIDKRVKGGLVETTFRLLDLKKQRKYAILEMDRNKSVVQRNKLNKLTDEERELIQERENKFHSDQQKRLERFQNKNLGGFERLYPIEIPKDLLKSEDEAD